MSTDSDSPDGLVVPGASGFPNATARYDIKEEELQASNGRGPELDYDEALDGQTNPPTYAPQVRDSMPPAKEYFCGIRGWRPRWLQVFRNKFFFTFLLCCNCFIEGALATGWQMRACSNIANTCIIAYSV